MQINSQAAQSDQSQPESLTDRYLAAPKPLKARARAAIGAANDDEALAIISTDTKAAATVAAILEAKDEGSMLTSAAPSAPEDVLYPRRGA